MNVDKISLTLYDFLGYILPGCIFLFACSIFEATFLVSSLFAITHIKDNLVFSIVIAYFLGQISHRIGSLLKDRKYKWFHDNQHRLSTPLYRHIENSLLEMYELKLEEEEKINTLETYLLADSYLVACGQTAERDTLMAREGFQKASMVSFGLMSLNLLLTLFKGGAKIQSAPATYSNLYFGATTVALILSIGLTLLFRNSFLFFNRLKLNNTLVIALALQKLNVQKDEGKSEK